MQSVSVAVAKDRLPYFLHLVEQGETIQVTRHGKPIAMIIRTEEDGEQVPTSFDIAYAKFRKQLDEEKLELNQEEWEEYFNIPREVQLGPRHEEDFE